MDELLGEFLTETGEGLDQLDVELVLGAAETTTNLSNDFMAVPERLHGVFCLTPAAAAASSAREGARRVKGGEGASEPGVRELVVPFGRAAYPVRYRS
jgi:hypothetical protein